MFWGGYDDCGPGGLGSPGLAALNISIPLINVFAGFGLLFGMGGATALAVDQGQGKGEQLNVIFTKSMAMSFLVGVLLTLVRIFFSGRTMLFLGGLLKRLWRWPGIIWEC